MMNLLGKSLVLVHLAASLLCLAGALAIYFQRLDWGWKEPRKDLDQRVASEYDKRAAALREAVRGRDLAYPPVAEAQKSLAEAMPYYPANHLWYRKELARLRSYSEPIEVKEVKLQGGVPELETPKKPLGKPVLDAPVAEVQKSYDSYVAELKDLQKKIDALAGDKGLIRGEIDREKILTFSLNGKDETGKIVKRGLYALLEEEAQAQALVKFEKDYLQPLWARALEEAELHRQRRQSLEGTLTRIIKGRGAKK